MGRRTQIGVPPGRNFRGKRQESSIAIVLVVVERHQAELPGLEGWKQMQSPEAAQEAATDGAMPLSCKITKQLNGV